MENQLVYVFADQTPELVHDLAFSPRFYWRVPGVGDLPAGRTGTRPHVRPMGTMCRTARCPPKVNCELLVRAKWRSSANDRFGSGATDCVDRAMSAVPQSRHALTRLARQFRVHERHFVPQKDRSLFPSEHRNFAPDPVVMASALRAQTPSGVSIGSSGR